LFCASVAIACEQSFCLTEEDSLDQPHDVALTRFELCRFCAAEGSRGFIVLAQLVRHIASASQLLSLRSGGMAEPFRPASS
jgi:hypothetical protein